MRCWSLRQDAQFLQRSIVAAGTGSQWRIAIGLYLRPKRTRWWFQTFLFSPLPGAMIQFDEHIFQMG